MNYFLGSNSLAGLLYLRQLKRNYSRLKILLFHDSGGLSLVRLSNHTIQAQIVVTNKWPQRKKLE